VSPFHRNKAYAECIEGRQAPLVLASDQYLVRLRSIQDRIESENPNDRDPEGTAEKELQASDWFKNEYVKSVKTVVDACVAEAAPWNRDVYAFGVAAYNSSIQETSATPAPGQSLPKENETGFGVWASASLQGPIFRKSKSSQLTLHARYTENMVRDRKVGSNTVTETVDGWQVGARYTQRLAGIDGGDQQFRLFIEGAYVEEKFGAIDDEFAQAGIGFEVQIQKDLFFQAVIGDTFDSDIDRGNYLSGQLKWSFSKGPAH
jgi:hypothetical protein